MMARSAKWSAKIFQLRILILYFDYIKNLFSFVKAFHYKYYIHKKSGTDISNEQQISAATILGSCNICNYTSLLENKSH